VQISLIVMHIDTIELFFEKFRVKMFWKGEAKLLNCLLLQIRSKTGSHLEGSCLFVLFGSVCLHIHSDIGCSVLGLSAYSKGPQERRRRLWALHRHTGLSGHLKNFVSKMRNRGDIIFYEINTKF
jgi:hypothetical protein